MFIEEIKLKLDTFFSKTLNRIVLILSIPVIFMIVFTLINNVYHLNSYKDLIISNYTSELNSFLSSTEDKMTSILSSTALIPSRSDIETMLSANAKPSQSDASVAMASLNDARNTSDLIDSIALYNKSANFVVTASGVYDAPNYFDKIYAYDKYSSKYWKDSHFSGGNTTILPPAVLKNDTSSITKTVVPVVVVPSDSRYSKNLLIYNISVDKLFEEFEVYKFTQNTYFYMIDNVTSEIFTKDIDHISVEDDTKKLQTLKNTLRSQTDIVLINGEKHLSIRSTKRSSVWGYTYMLTIPYSDISRSTYKISFTIFIFMAALALLLILYLTFGSNFLYKPWHKLAVTANNLDPSDKHGADLVPNDIENFVNNTFSNAITSMQKLEHNLASVLPLSQKQYLINILNDNCTDAEPLKYLSFKYEYFAAVSVSITINPTFLADASATTAAQLIKAVRNAISCYFSDKFVTYELSTSNNVLYLLLNLENDMCSEEISDVISKIKDVFAVDSENIEILFGVGGIYKGVDGLQLTHEESQSNMAKELSSVKIQFSTANTEFNFSEKNANVLTNYLMSGHFDKGKEFLSTVFENMKNIPQEKQCIVYDEIINTIKKVMHKRAIYISDNSYDFISNMTKNTEKFNNGKINSYIFNFLDTVEESILANSTRIDITAIIEYINEHFAEDISLEDLALSYSTSAKYLSKRIKQYLNVPFKEYLTQLRIEKAKELLENGTSSVTDIASTVGFQNRNAFTRAFKLKVGLSATEYKSTFKKENE